MANTPAKTQTRRSQKQIMLDMLDALKEKVNDHCEKPAAAAANKTPKTKTPRTKKANGNGAPSGNQAAPKNARCLGTQAYNNFIKKYVADHAAEYMARTGKELTYKIAQDGPGTAEYRKLCGLAAKPTKANTGTKKTRTKKANLTNAIAQGIVPANVVQQLEAAGIKTKKATRKSKKANANGTAMPMNTQAVMNLAAMNTTAKPKSKKATRKVPKTNNSQKPVSTKTLMNAARKNAGKTQKAKKTVTIKTTPQVKTMSPAMNMTSASKAMNMGAASLNQLSTLAPTSPPQQQTQQKPTAVPAFTLEDEEDFENSQESGSENENGTRYD